MKQTIIGSEVAILGLTKIELGLIVYLYKTSVGKLNKKERAFIQEIEAVIEKMDEIE